MVGQTFGRETGFIAGSARISDPDRKLPLVILLPEDQKDIDAVIGKIDDTVTRFGRAVVIISEGYKAGDFEKKFDLSGQIMYGSSRTTAARLLVNQCMDSGIQAREYNPTVDQRMDIESTLEFDLDIAFQLGEFTIKQFMDGNTDFLASVSNGAGTGNIIAIPHSEIKDYSRIMPDEWVAQGKYDVTDRYLDYLNSFFKLSQYEKKYENRDYFTTI